MPSSVDIDDSSQITLGVRPENVYPKDHGTVANATEPIALDVDVVQPMGDELMVYLRAPDSGQTFESDLDDTDQTSSKTEQLLMSVDPTVDINVGQSIDIVLDRSQVHLFNSANGDALVHSLEQKPDPVSR